ncbi:hypothetical protein OJF2_61420 [Aquisphaera giovannonii]|uniref:Cytochrome c domain-containing protein n=1 Tax=Aquisphaera giovannonii TaxID=406548 RepID=A0A5B9WC81_9BACT|nr:DUF1549 domain-containing protein [Aquisphaera giovannonii]QEH37551.1 hypothetical protein OJF2_61420 [Aquisphaera giovannonii]
MRWRDLIFLTVMIGGGLALVRGAVRIPAATTTPQRATSGSAVADSQAAAIRVAVEGLDRAFRQQWAEQGIRPAPPADDLTVMRRLSLALTGAIPSLEEIRRFESRPAGSRLDAWLDDLMADRRTSDFLAERFARAFVGTEDGPFLVFRRRRFASWLSDAILANRPYDAIVRDLVADRGLWTDHPATNFVSVTFNPDTGRPDPERLAARVSRALLGVRIDCAQCHDHPFQPWKQADFRGLAAYFGGAYSGLRGIRDGESAYKPLDRKTKAEAEVAPRVPFRPELVPEAGTPRERLAAWIVDPSNPNLARATANRVWAILLGRPLVDPVDDLPVNVELPPALERLAADFSGHGYDLHRLIRVIAGSEVFRLDSTDPPAGKDPNAAPDDESWAAFPAVRLRPEQVAGALFQAASLPTIGPQSHWFVRLATYTGRNDFVRRYGDTGEDEFHAAGGTIPQRLLLMNGDIVREKTGRGLFSASQRVAELAPDDRAAVEVAYLIVLTRRPTPEESAHFAGRLAGTAGDDRKDRLTDLFWTLVNSTEFSWNH